jgi:hypothetical protein
LFTLLASDPTCPGRPPPSPRRRDTRPKSLLCGFFSGCDGHRQIRLQNTARIPSSGPEHGRVRKTVDSTRPPGRREIFKAGVRVACLPGFPLDHFRQKRVGDEAPPQHPAGYVRESGFQRSGRSKVIDIPVVNHRMIDIGQAGFESRKIDTPAYICTPVRG